MRMDFITLATETDPRRGILRQLVHDVLGGVADIDDSDDVNVVQERFLLLNGNNGTTTL
jgi:hypothetical protein